MGPPGAPEELRFDFGGSLAEPVTTARPGRRRVGTGDDSEDVARALQRRVDEVIAVAHSREKSQGRRRPQALLSPEPGPETTEPVEGETTLRRVEVDETVETVETDGSIPAERLPGAQLGAQPGLVGDPGEDGRESDGALSIAAFYERLRRVLIQSFPGEIWVTGEIRGLRESRGHRYLELADEGAENQGRPAGQQLEVVCWSREWPPVANALAEAGVSLEVGRVVRVRGRVSVWEGGSKLRFTLSAIDVEALLGGIAAARHRLLQALAAEDLLEANRRLGCPLVPLRIGVVTSPGSEAHRDFVGQLERSGYAFEVHLEPSLVQGPEAPFQLAGALGRLASARVDLAVVVRGGGARGDLAAFDSEQVARAIATAPFPVWTGIGHTGDHSVADEVAQRACITPTACGEAVVAVVGDYVGAIAASLDRLSSLATARLDGATAGLTMTQGALSRGVRHQLERRRDVLETTASRIGRAAAGVLVGERGSLARRASLLGAATARVLEREGREAHRCQQVLRAYDPRRQLERGWSLTRDESGHVVRSRISLVAGTVLVTRLSDGEVRSVVSDDDDERRSR